VTQTATARPGFHTRDGWHFRRVGAAVEVRCTTGAVILDAATWASVVAAVSVHGETRDTYRAALQLHNGEVSR